MDSEVFQHPLTGQTAAYKLDSEKKLQTSTKLWHGKLYFIDYGQPNTADPACIVLHWNRLGTNSVGNNKTLFFKTKANAIHYFNSRLRDKRRKKYVEVTSTGYVQPVVAQPAPALVEWDVL